MQILTGILSLLIGLAAQAQSQVAIKFVYERCDYFITGLVEHPSCQEYPMPAYGIQELLRPGEEVIAKYQDYAVGVILHELDGEKYVILTEYVLSTDQVKVRTRRKLRPMQRSSGALEVVFDNAPWDLTARVLTYQVSFSK